MKSKKLPTIRQFGQLPLPPSFLLKTSNSESDEPHPHTIIPTNKKSPISLSDFLKRKLHKDAAPTPPKSTQEQRDSSSAAGRKDAVGAVKRQVEIDPPLDEKVFQLFKHPREGTQVSHGVTADCDVQGSEATKEQDSRIRNPFCASSLGGHKRSATAAHLVILGGDPKPKSSKRRDAGFIQNKKAKPLYNHYANGSGWWDCNMEGIDNEAVGCSDVWEGMGATANLGGLEWH